MTTKLKTSLFFFVLLALFISPTLAQPDKSERTKILPTMGQTDRVEVLEPLSY